MNESDSKVGQFGKIGEHMVGYELSKRGWIIFFPPYDERVDIVALKFRCKKCHSMWNNKHNVACLNDKCTKFNISISNIKDKIEYKNKVCPSGHVIPRTKDNAQESKCPICKAELNEIALCMECKQEIGTIEQNCSNLSCDSKEYELLFRSIQVKASHYVDHGKNIAFNFKYQDLIASNNHFLIVYNSEIKNNIERHTYWVLSILDFKSIKNVNTVSFKIYQNDRVHYQPDKLEPFKFKEEEYYAKEKEIESTSDLRKKSQFEIEKKKLDAFTKLED